VGGTRSPPEYPFARKPGRKDDSEWKQLWKGLLARQEAVKRCCYKVQNFVAIFRRNINEQILFSYVCRCKMRFDLTL